MPSEIKEDDRTTALGFFNYAISYWKSANYLKKIKILGITHPSAPMLFLYAHAIELFLKSNVRLKKNIKELKDLGHDLNKLKRYSKDLFQNTDSKYSEIIDFLTKYKINNSSRYIYTGFKGAWPEQYA